MGVPNTLFKYLKSKDANDFFRQGIIRIGTLYDYRKTERHGTVIGDHQEGLILEQEHYQNLTMQSNEDVPPFIRGRITVETGGMFQVMNSTMGLSHQSPNFYIYCVTTKFDPKVMKEFGYDTCFEIIDTTQFINGLNRCMRHKGTFIGAYECIYTEKVVSPGNKPNHHPALVKDPKFSYQNEVRLLWKPNSEHPRPVRMTCRKIPRHCSYANNS